VRASRRLKGRDERSLAGFVPTTGANRLYLRDRRHLLADDARLACSGRLPPNRRPLKILVITARAVGWIRPESRSASHLRDDYDARIERGMMITVEGFDWNCPQHITPRFTEAEIAKALVPLRAKLDALEAENTALRAQIVATGKQTPVT
jgi:hypothetical protein